MPVNNTPPHIKKPPARTDNRLRELERTRVKAGTVAATVSGESFPGYSAPGIAVDDTVFPSWYALMAPHAYVAGVVDAVVAGGTDAEFHLSLNGATIEVFTLSAGETFHLYAVSFSVGLGEFLGGTLVTGGGVQNFAMQLQEAAT